VLKQIIEVSPRLQVVGFGALDQGMWISRIWSISSSGCVISRNRLA